MLMERKTLVYMLSYSAYITLAGKQVLLTLQNSDMRFLSRSFALTNFTACQWT